jgi:hypothetical protein
MPPLTPQQQALIAQNNLMRRTLGRFSGPEFFTQQAFATNSSPVLNRPVPVGQTLMALHIVWRGRVVIGTANMTSVGAQGVAPIINRLLITGASEKFGNLTLWDISGGSLFSYVRLFQVVGNSNYIGSTSATYTRQPDETVPQTVPGATFGNTGTYDIETHYWVPFFPLGPGMRHTEQIAYGLRPEDWPNGINVQLFFGDGNSYGTPAGGTTFTFTAFGSASGTPVVNVYTETANLNNLQNSHPSAICCRAEQQSVQSVAAVSNAVLLISPVRERITNLIIKSGTFAGGSSQANVFGTLSDFMIGNLLLNFNGTNPRNFQDWFEAKEYYGKMFNTILPAGYLPISFIDSGNLDALLDASKLPSGSRFDLTCNVLTAPASAQVNVIQEWVKGDPQTRLPGQV